MAWHRFWILLLFVCGFALCHCLPSDFSTFRVQPYPATIPFRIKLHRHVNAAIAPTANSNFKQYKRSRAPPHHPVHTSAPKKFPLRQHRLEGASHEVDVRVPDAHLIPPQEPEELLSQLERRIEVDVRSSSHYQNNIVPSTLARKSTSMSI
jgi:hypothetical protein